MALEDLTGTGKYISSLNAAWPVDDDWVDEGDNHIRGIKNVLRNTFPDTNGPIKWSSGQALMPDGSVGAPGMSWVNDPDSGWWRDPGTSDVMYSRNGVMVFRIEAAGTRVSTGLVVDGSVGAAPGQRGFPSITFSSAPTLGFFLDVANGTTNLVWGGADVWRGQSSGFDVVAPLRALGGASVTGNADVTGAVSVLKGYNGVPGSWGSATLVLNGGTNAGLMPGIGMLSNGGGIAGSITCDAVGNFRYGTTSMSGPAALQNQSIIVNPNGATYARSFNLSTVLLSARGAAVPVTGALSKVLQMRGVRFRNGETGRDELALDEVEVAFPELVNETVVDAVVARGVNYMGLVAPLVEAVRELEARVKLLEARVAGS